MSTTNDIPGSPVRRQRSDSVESISLSIDCPLDKLSFACDPREMSEVDVRIQLAANAGVDRKESELVKGEFGELEVVLEEEERAKQVVVSSDEVSDEGIQSQMKFKSPPFSCEENSKLPGPYPDEGFATQVEEEVKEVTVDIPRKRIAALAAAAAEVAAKQVEVEVYEGRPPIVKYPSGSFSYEENSKLPGPYPVEGYVKQVEEVKEVAVVIPYKQIAAFAAAAAEIAAKQVEVEVYEGRPPIVKYPSGSFSCEENLRLSGPYTIPFNCEENIALPGPYPISNWSDEVKEVEVPFTQISAIASLAAAVAVKKVEVEVYEGRPPIVKYPSGEFSSEENAKLAGPYPIPIPLSQIAAVASAAAAIAAKQVEVDVYEGRPPIVKHPSGEFSSEENSKLPGPYPIVKEELIEVKEVVVEVPFAQIAAVATAAAAIAAKQVEIEVYEGRPPIVKFPSATFSYAENVKLPGPYTIPFSCDENILLPGPYPVVAAPPLVVEVVHHPDDKEDVILSAVSEGRQSLASDFTHDVKKEEPDHVHAKVDKPLPAVKPATVQVSKPVTVQQVDDHEIKVAENKEAVDDQHLSLFSRIGRSSRRNVSSPGALAPIPAHSDDPVPQHHPNSASAPPKLITRRSSFFGVTKTGKPRRFRPIKNLKRLFSGRTLPHS